MDIEQTRLKVDPGETIEKKGDDVKRTDDDRRPGAMHTTTHKDIH